jgi:hypothetical protein
MEYFRDILTVNMKQWEKKAEIDIKNDSASLPTETLLSVRKTLVLRFWGKEMPLDGVAVLWYPEQSASYRNPYRFLWKIIIVDSHFLLAPRSVPTGRERCTRVPLCFIFWRKLVSCHSGHAVWSCIVFCRPFTEPWVQILAWAWICLFSVFMLSCVSRSLAMGRYPAEGLLPNVARI